MRRASLLKLPAVLASYAPPINSLYATVIGFGLLALSIVIRLPLDRLAGVPLPPFITIYPLLPAIGFVAGFRIGVIAVVIAAAGAAFFWIEPVGSLPPADMLTILTLGAFCFAGTFTVWFGYLARVALDIVSVQQVETERNAKEAVHRTKNLLAVVQALAFQQAKRSSTIEEFRNGLDGLLGSMSRAQDMLLNSGSGVVSLGQLVDRATEHCRHHNALTVVSGPDTAAPADTLGLTLALHELCTNSLKYGAMSGETGKITLTWTVTDKLCELAWLEEIGRTSAPSKSEGSGSALIRNALAKQDGGKVEYIRTPEVIDCRFRWSLS